MAGEELCDGDYCSETDCCDSPSRCKIHDEITFSDIKAAYQYLSRDLEPEGLASVSGSTILTRLLREFLRDPDVCASWASPDTNGTC
jgi:hypothetical protein